MSMIKVEHLTFSYPSSFDEIFHDVSFQIDTDWRLGFTGRNGRGKTTFLQLLCGRCPYSGKITSSVPFDYFPYPVADAGRTTLEILEEICPAAAEWEFLRELSGLELDPETLWRPFETLSGGEQTKALLAALFLNEGRFLLIDEPTNHLDRQGRALVSAYLRKKKGFILVSHDRRFLDGCVDHVLSLNRANIEVQSGSFSAWLERFQQRQAWELAQDRRLRQDIRRLQQAAGRASAWAGRTEASKSGAPDKGYVGHKAAKLMKRAKAMEDRQRQAAEEKQGLLNNLERAEALKLRPLSHYAGTLIACRDAAVCYQGAAVCEPVSFTLAPGERIALEGKNGSGKSSLLKLLAGEALSHTGAVTLAPGLVVSCVPQSTAHLRGTLSEYARASGLDESLFKTILRKLDFERAQFEKDMADFSGGQKKKVLIAKSLCERAHVYLWDEPLNFIDLYSRMQLETLLREIAPSMIFVEHDSAFQEAVATRVVTLRRPQGGPDRPAADTFFLSGANDLDRKAPGL